MNSEELNDGLLIAGFTLGTAVFGVDAKMVQEVVRVGNITPVHHAPECVVGVMNLRGRIVTVIDLRTKLGLTRIAIGGESRIFIVEWQNEQVGLLVDRVTDAINVAEDAVRPSPGNVHGVQGQQVRGVCQGTGGKLVAILDLEAVLKVEEEKVVAGRVE